MTNKTFIEKATKLVKNYTIEHMDKSMDIPDFDVFTVWNCYILGDQKALLSTTISDGMYYEVTYDKVRDKIYLDAYKKFENREIDPEFDTYKSPKGQEINLETNIDREG